MDVAERRVELTRFLRARRAGLSPQAVGLPNRTRRRTPGLRREELAELAGVGTTWYTWLEQGRPFTVSAQMLDNLAWALRLDAVERAHLFILARGEAPALPPPVLETVEPALQQILDALGTNPAYVVNARWEAVAWNVAACLVFSDFAARRPRDRNLLWCMFTDPSQRRLLVDWEGAAQETLAYFRASTGRHVGEAWFSELITDLTAASPEFAAWWPRNDVRGTPRDAQKELNHPLVGRLVLQPTPLQVAQRPDLWLIVHTPLPGTDTAAKLQCLLAGASTAAVTSADPIPSAR